MANRKINQRQAVKSNQGEATRSRKRRVSGKAIIFRVGCVLVLAIIAIVTAVLVVKALDGFGGNEVAVDNSEAGAEDSSEITELEDEKMPAPVDFQSVINEWVEDIGGNKSIIIYDLERDEYAGKYNTTEDYGTASLYKLFVVYEGYRRVEAGEWNGDEIVGATGYTINKCLDLAIRESYSPCAEALWAKIGHAELDTIIENDYNITNSDISHLVSNSEDIMKIMKRFYEHPDFNDAARIEAMWDSFLVQPETTYNWRQGLPSGFTKANVYNKVGWEYNPDGGYWNIYHDAAIVNFPEDNRNFIVVVMTNRVPYQQIAKLGTMLEEYYYSSND